MVKALVGEKNALNSDQILLYGQNPEFDSVSWMVDAFLSKHVISILRWPRRFWHSQASGGGFVKRAGTLVWAISQTLWKVAKLVSYQIKMLFLNLLHQSLSPFFIAKATVNMTPWISFLLNPTIIFSLVLLLLLANLFLNNLHRSSRMPPGPIPLPIIGNLHLINIKRQDVSFMKVRSKGMVGKTFCYQQEWPGWLSKTLQVEK